MNTLQTYNINLYLPNYGKSKANFTWSIFQILHNVTNLDMEMTRRVVENFIEHPRSWALFPFPVKSKASQVDRQSPFVHHEYFQGWNVLSDAKVVMFDGHVYLSNQFTIQITWEKSCSIHLQVSAVEFSWPIYLVEFSWPFGLNKSLSQILWT